MLSLDIFNELSELITIKINSCHSVFHRSGWVETKVHKDYDIWLIKEGITTVKTDCNSIVAEAGDAIFFYPEIPYTAFMGSQGCSFIYIHFDFSIGSNYRVIDGLNLSGLISGGAKIKEAANFDIVYQQYDKKIPMSSLMIKGSFTMLLAALIRLKNNEKAEHRLLTENKIKRDTASLIRLNPVFEYISRNMHKRLRISEIASFAGMSEKYFMKYFKSALGITPYQYINQVKMNRARDYIYSRKYSIKEIAHLLGYSDQYTFSKAFKKYYNVPPSRFM